MYIYQEHGWPNFYWNDNTLIHLVGEAMLETLILDVLKTNEIEGFTLNPEQVRSSLARRLGLEISGLINSDRDVDGIVDMMVDATQRYNHELSSERFFGWHSSLFPSGRSGMFKIKVGAWRDDRNDPMQVVSGAMGQELWQICCLHDQMEFPSVFIQCLHK